MSPKYSLNPAPFGTDPRSIGGDPNKFTGDETALVHTAKMGQPPLGDSPIFADTAFIKKLCLIFPLDCGYHSTMLVRKKRGS